MSEMSEIFGIKVVRFTDDQKVKVEQILIKGNKLLKKWASFAGARKYRPFRIAVVHNKIKDNVIEMNYACSGKKTCVIPSHLMPSFLRDLPSMQEAHRVIHSDLGNRTVENTVMQNFVAMVSKLANKMCRTNVNSGLTFDDYMQEGLVHLIDCIYNWTPYEEDKDTELSTFLQVSVSRHFHRIINKNRITGSLKNADVKLLRKIRKLQSCNITFDEILQKLELTKKQISRVMSIKDVVSLTRKKNNDDYSELVVEDKKSKKFFKDDDDDYKLGDEFDPEEREYFDSVFAKCRLTDVEQEIIRLSIMGKRGWQTEYANNHVNPATGKTYSRMRITQILQSARAKLQPVFNESL